MMTKNLGCFCAEKSKLNKNLKIDFMSQKRMIYEKK